MPGLAGSSADWCLIWTGRTRGRLRARTQASSPARPVLVDEFQQVPEILDAIKAELNRDTRPGRFV